MIRYRDSQKLSVEAKRMIRGVGDKFPGERNSGIWEGENVREGDGGGGREVMMSRVR